MELVCGSIQYSGLMQKHHLKLAPPYFSFYKLTDKTLSKEEYHKDYGISNLQSGKHRYYLPEETEEN
uniref:Uncharacterized protein n=1 Tax=Anguilla anguilla TaxID=7936 RepID=A0A0E9RM72_ANGAN